MKPKILTVYKGSGVGWSSTISFTDGTKFCVNTTDSVPRTVIHNEISKLIESVEYRRLLTRNRVTESIYQGEPNVGTK